MSEKEVTPEEELSRHISAYKQILWSKFGQNPKAKERDAWELLDKTIFLRLNINEYHYPKRVQGKIAPNTWTVTENVGDQGSDYRIHLEQSVPSGIKFYELEFGNLYAETFSYSHYFLPKAGDKVLTIVKSGAHIQPAYAFLKKFPNPLHEAKTRANKKGAPDYYNKAVELGGKGGITSIKANPKFKRK